MTSPHHLFLELPSSQHNKMFQAQLVFSLFHSGIRVFKEDWFLLVMSGIRSQCLGPRCVHFYWDISASGPTLWSELGNINIYFTSIFISVTIHLYYKLLIHTGNAKPISVLQDSSNISLFGFVSSVSVGDQSGYHYLKYLFSCIESPM